MVRGEYSLSENIAGEVKSELPRFLFTSEHERFIEDMQVLSEGRPVQEGVKTTNQLFERGEMVRDAYQQQLRDLAELIGAELIHVKMKGRGRAEQKIEDYERVFGDNGAKYLLDVVRGRLVFESINDLLDALPKIQTSLNVVRVKERLRAALSERKYGDILINARVGGMVVELQLMPKFIHDRYEEDHVLYRAIEQAEKAGEPLEKIKALKIEKAGLYAGLEYSQAAV